MTKASSSFAAGVAALMLPFAAAIAQTPPPEQGSPQQGQGAASFESLDTNSDGRISKTEAEANANVKSQFSSYDLNGDGYIERSEVDRANQSQQSETPQQPQQ